MTATVFLRVASILSFLFAGGHALGGLQSWSPAGETEVLQAMRSFRFDAEGVSRTYLEFYLGFGLILSVYLLLQAVVLWQLAALARAEPARLRPLVAAFMLAQMASGALSWRFIFAIPVVFSALIALSLGMALYASRPTRS